MNKNINNQFTEWVNIYSDILYSWAYHKTSNKEIAEDIVQETFMAAFKSLNNFKFDSQPKTWLFSILNNKIIDYYRKSAKNIVNTTKDEQVFMKATDELFNSDGHWTNTSLSTWQDEEHLLDNQDFNTVLSLCIGKLPNNWRLAIESKYQKDKNASEICKELNITSSNYWQMIHRAKLQLKICIEKNWTN
ncbi:MAG: sigma-70 family RNA polymerase sigma factor [Vicingaceae bacterium]|nr:sigma-70 family RNA polymerase sigma factor [Vicingaceae bacterium]